MSDESVRHSDSGHSLDSSDSTGVVPVTAETIARPEADWSAPPDPELGWTFDQVKDLDLDRDSGVYAPAPRVSVHRQVMRTGFPFPVEIDLKALLEV
jgi:hypothetical protein